MKKIASLSALCGVGLMFTACGDDVTKINESEGVRSVSEFRSLEDCTVDNAGDIVFAADSGKVFYCAGGEWERLNGKNGIDGKDGAAGASGESCNAVSLADKSGYSIVCGGDTVGVVKNGANGLNGADGSDGVDGIDGQNGENGTSGMGCTSQALADGSGYKIICAGDSVGVIKNGKNGIDGRDGIDGMDGSAGGSCSMSALADGSGYKIVCGGDSVGVVLNGTDGADGKDGEVSAVGCTVQELADGVGYKVVCNGDSVGVLKNGENGKNGEDGISSCSLVDNTDGTSTLTCGESSTILYNKYCDGKSFSHETEICFENKIYKIKDSWKFLNPHVEYGVFVDSRDNQVYKTVQVGTQTWMAENLNYSDSVSTKSLKERSWCYDDQEENCDSYGRLYTWAAAIDSVSRAEFGETCGYGAECSFDVSIQGICPEGFHIPDDTEWHTFHDFVKNSDNIIIGTTDDYGFSATLAGLKGSSNYLNNGTYGYFWSTTVSSANYASVFRVANSAEDMVTFNKNLKSFGQSVRCLKD